MVEIKVRRKFFNRIGDSRALSIPPFFLDAMEALDCKEVVMTIPDRDHILIEVVRNE